MSSPRTCGERGAAAAQLEARRAQQQLVEAATRLVALGPVPQRVEPRRGAGESRLVSTARFKRSS